MAANTTLWTHSGLLWWKYSSGSSPSRLAKINSEPSGVLLCDFAPPRSDHFRGSTRLQRARIYNRLSTGGNPDITQCVQGINSDSP